MAGVGAESDDGDDGDGAGESRHGKEAGEMVGWWC